MTALFGRVLAVLALALSGGAVQGQTNSAAPGTGAELAQLCARDPDACQAFLGRIAGGIADDKTVCLPHGMLPEHLRGAYAEWAAASEPDLLAREPAEQAVALALKELFPCDE